MKYLTLIITLFFITPNQQTDKLTGSYNYLIEENNFYIQKDKITFNDSVFVFDNKYLPKGKILYGNAILLDNFINTDLIISISKDQIKKDTILFYMHDKQSSAANYLDEVVGKGKLIKIK
ncbi:MULTISPECIES: hypothetical protein [unclassified Flavobacterium]|jgi:hypothetical protein|uniref:hypothetical protein n=1 Tax=unclassified Flavobacterium TaxID=196869 RepID=UPI0012A9DAFC|nr:MULTISPECIES: hypothetical protein [unclassified Flavobacterium]MBF4487003.1 hypothetical protein [Flavobacterium sp. CSZ]QGK75553.1 hypothetical protein GIY83_16185 [Flavobacterium sp. SLB02]